MVCAVCSAPSLSTPAQSEPPPPPTPLINYVQALQGDSKKWDKASEIRRVNPLMWQYAESRKVLFEERDEARLDSAARSAFFKYRLNLPLPDENEVLLTVDQWESVQARPVAARVGRPIVGVDLGGGRAWSAATAIWDNARCESLAVAPGIPSIEAQERRDRVRSGAYQKLVYGGSLRVADGLHIQPPSQLVLMIFDTWGTPEFIICDRFRYADLLDAVAGRCPVYPRVSQWSESSNDIRALRKIASDGPLSVPEESRGLMIESLRVAMVHHDSSGNMKPVKRGSNNQARDDVAAALILSSGAHVRQQSRPKATFRSALV